MMPDRVTPPPVSGFGFLKMPSPVTVRLPNGIEIVSLNQGDDEINSIHVMFTGGYGEADTVSVQNLMAGTVTEGSVSRSGEYIASVMEDNGSWFGVKSTDHHTVFSVHSLNRNLADVLPCFAEIVFSPSFPSDVIETKRRKLIDTRKVNLQKVGFMSGILSRQQLYGKNHPLSRIDSEEEILNVSRQQLIDNHSRIVSSEPPVIFVAGKITPDILNLIRNTFERYSFDSETKKPLSIIPFSPDYKAMCLHHQMEGKIQNSVSLTIPAIPRNHPDYFPLRFAAVVLGGYFGSRLMTNIREQKGYTYGISAGLAGVYEGGYITISSECDNAYVEPLIEEVRKEIITLRTDLIPVGEWNVTSNYIRSALASTLDNPFSIIDHYVKSYLFDMPADSFEVQQRILAESSPETVLRMARKYMDPDRMFVATAGFKQ